MKQSIQINNPEITRLGVSAGIAFCRAMAADQLQDDKVIAVSLGIADPILNTVIHVQSSESEIENKIIAVVSFFKKHNVDWTWIINPLSEPTELAPYLIKHGMTLIEESPSMYFDLTKSFSIEKSKRFDIRELTQDNDLKEWIIPIAEAFPGNDENDDGEAFRIINNTIPHGPGTAFRHYTAYHENQAVSSVTLFLSEHAAMIHNLGTKHQYCGKGYGTALTLHALSEAKHLGFKHCFLDSSTQGFSVYQRIGFEVYAICPIYGSNTT